LIPFAIYSVKTPKRILRGYEDNKYYPTSFRIVRFKVSKGVYQCVATNLDEDELPLEEIKKLYRARWGETSFRQLKYTIGLVDCIDQPSSHYFYNL